MKKILITLFILFTFTNCQYLRFDDINTYRGSVILDICNDTTGIDNYILTVKHSNGRYYIIHIKPTYGKLFNVGDTI